MGETLREKCGLFGIYGENYASERVYLGLHNNQHRGQESCGICSWDDKAYQIHHGMGIVNDVFDKKRIDTLDGRIAIGHARYSTNGASCIENAQPFLEKGIAIAHNGQISNYNEIRQVLRNRGIDCSVEQSDTQAVLKFLTHEEKGDLVQRISNVFGNIRPSYSMIMISEGKLIGIRDPAGVRPLEIGKTKKGYALSSETVGFDIIDADYIREVRPGELVVIDENGLQSHSFTNSESEQRCIFEKIYFSRPDSLLRQSVSIGMVRREFGRALYRESPIEADIVIAVPDSSIDAARGVSEESGYCYERGLIRNHYIGRTFIEPSQELRDAAVLKKFNVDGCIVKDQRIILVDDSIVRGTTLKELVRLIKKKGAREVHVRISSPPYINSCGLGVDTADEKRIIARHNSVEEIKEFIGADSLYYLSKQGMLDNPYLRGQSHCTLCFD